MLKSRNSNVIYVRWTGIGTKETRPDPAMNGTVIQKIHGLYDKYRHENDHQHVGLLSTAITTVKTRVCSRPIIYKLGAMPGTGILYDDWKDYDNRKTRQKLDPSTFCCEDWEVGYLASKIRNHHPFPEPAIRQTPYSLPERSRS